MVFIAIKLFLFLSVVISFGYLVSFLFLKERKISTLVPLSVLIGVSGYVFFVNALAYFSGLKEAVWLILLLFVLFISYQIYAKGIWEFCPESDFTRKELKILFGLAMLISIISGIVTLRALDPDTYVHLTFSSTISEGNFPLMNPVDPDTLIPYHYGPDLLSAVTHRVTGVSLLRGYNIQTFFFSGLTFLLAFILAFYITGKFYTSIIASLFFFFGAGALFLNITNGFSPLYHKYILGENVVGVWRFAAEMLWPKVNNFYTYAIRNYTTVMGTPIMLSILYLYFKFIDEGKTQIKKIIIAGLLLGFLALSLETNFVILSFVLGVALPYKIYLLFCNKNDTLREKYINGVKVIVLVLLIGSAVAYMQGGVITASLKSDKSVVAGQSSGVGGRQSFVLNNNPSELIISRHGEDRVPIFSLAFLKEFGLTLILFPMAVFVFRKDEKILFLSSIGAVAFLIPVFIVYASWPGELARVFVVSTTFFSFISALLICFLFGKYKENTEVMYILVIISLMVIFGGLSFQLGSMITPYSNFGKIKVPFVASLPALSGTDSRTYEWIRDNTPGSSRFFPYNQRLIIETGRMSPGDNAGLFPEYKVPIYKDIVNNCDVASVNKLGINYFVVSPEGFPRESFLSKCASLNASLVFGVKESEYYREIYQVKN